MFVAGQKKILKTLLSDEEFNYYICCIFAITFGRISVKNARSLVINKIGKDRFRFLQKSMQNEFDIWFTERGVENGNKS